MRLETRERWVSILENSDANVSMGRRMVSPPQTDAEADDEFFFGLILFCCSRFVFVQLAPDGGVRSRSEPWGNFFFFFVFQLRFLRVCHFDLLG